MLPTRPEQGTWWDGGIRPTLGQDTLRALVDRADKGKKEGKGMPKTRARKAE